MYKAIVSYQDEKYILWQFQDKTYGIVDQCGGQNIIVKTYKYKASALRFFDKYVERLESRWERYPTDEYPHIEYF